MRVLIKTMDSEEQKRLEREGLTGSPPGVPIHSDYKVSSVEDFKDPNESTFSEVDL